MSRSVERPIFVQDQYLGAEDLNAGIAYSQTQLARMRLSGHSWGISLGLQLTEVPGPNNTLNVVVQPGFAWDGFGRTILVPVPTKLSADLFSVFDASVPPNDPHPEPILVPVWIRYDEQGARPTAEGYFTRVVEGFAFEAGQRSGPALRDPVRIAGVTMDATEALKHFVLQDDGPRDANVPHQELPQDGEYANWLVPLGMVKYQPGKPGSLMPAANALETGRRYAGVIASTIEATDGTVRVRDRQADRATPSGSELLRVEGSLRCEANIRVDGELTVAGNPVAAAGSSTRMVYGTVQEGQVFAGSQFGVTKEKTGVYRITFDPPFTGTPTVVVTRVYGRVHVEVAPGDTLKPAQSAILDYADGGEAVVATANTQGALADGNFTFLAMGPR